MTFWGVKSRFFLRGALPRTPLGLCPRPHSLDTNAPVVDHPPSIPRGTGAARTLATAGIRRGRWPGVGGWVGASAAARGGWVGGWVGSYAADRRRQVVPPGKEP